MTRFLGLLGLLGLVLSGVAPRSQAPAVRARGGAEVGVVVLLASWCRYSAYEARYELPRFAAYLHAKGAPVSVLLESDRGGLAQAGPPGRPELGINAQASEPAADSSLPLAYQATMGLSEPLRLASREYMERTYRGYFDAAFPVFVFVAPDGRVLTRARGIMRAQDLETTFMDFSRS